MSKAEGASSLRWDLGNGGESTEENPIVTYPNETKMYEVMFVAMNQCGVDTMIKSIEIEQTTSVSELKDNITVFPNPFKEEIMIEVLSGDFIHSVELLSIDGRVLSLSTFTHTI